MPALIARALVKLTLLASRHPVLAMLVMLACLSPCTPAQVGSPFSTSPTIPSTTVRDGPGDASVLAGMLGLAPEQDATTPDTFLAVFQGYLPVMIAAFVVTLLTTPIMRRLAIANGIVDKPNARKVHTFPIAYLGGVAVFLGIMAGIFISFVALRFDGLLGFHDTKFIDDRFLTPQPVRFSVILGITVVMLLGLWDDVLGISPRFKIAGLFATAAALAIDDVGVRVAAGLIMPVARALGVVSGNAGTLDFGLWIVPAGAYDTLMLHLPIPGTAGISLDVVYWTGTAIIAIFVLGACNASNLIDGLDGLLSGVTAIANAGLLTIAILLALVDDGPRDTQRIVLSMAVLGACLGFLPHNFNPAVIFLGDCGSLMLGFCTIVVVLTLGDTGKTHLVLAGLIIYTIPLIDTALAIVRRKLAGKRMSDPDSDHLHHMLKRALGVKGAVLTLYAIGIGFAALGVISTLGRARVTYALTLLFASYIGVTAIKIARRKQFEEQARARFDTAHPELSVATPPGPPAAPAREGEEAHATSRA
ncbi:MAG: MraY family glycosyltransferase [Phycisphaerales bacterium]|jgi:UDP-GlcNAc:undecaprenyl-phosphate GlcNAc-1-phosphate transferase|nr:MraY family glycosyltransferase [Phycisphaerales bacterium]